MSKIKTLLVPNEEPIFKVNFPAFTEEDIINYAHLYGIDLETLVEKDAFFIPGHHTTGFFRSKKFIDQLKKQDFPLVKITSFFGGNSSTKENRILLNQELTFFLQKRNNPEEGNFLFLVEIHREQFPKIVLQGYFVFIGEEQKRN